MKFTRRLQDKARNAHVAYCEETSNPPGGMAEDSAPQRPGREACQRKMSSRRSRPDRHPCTHSQCCFQVGATLTSRRLPCHACSSPRRRWIAITEPPSTRRFRREASEIVSGHRPRSAPLTRSSRFRPARTISVRALTSQKAENLKLHADARQEAFHTVVNLSLRLRPRWE